MTGARSVEVAGPIRRLAFPDLCASCGGAPATERLRIERAFERWTGTSEVYSTWVFGSVKVPLCTVCAARHHSLEERLSPVGRLGLLLATWAAIPMVRGLGFMAYFLLKAAAQPAIALFNGAAAGVFALIGLGSGAVSWQRSRPRAIPEPTEISRCFIFTDNEAKLLEPEHHTIVLKNPAFAAAFAEANRSRLWNPDGAQARVARRLRPVAWSLMILALLALAIWETLKSH